MIAAIYARILVATLCLLAAATGWLAFDSPLKFDEVGYLGTDGKDLGVDCNGLADAVGLPLAGQRRISKIEVVGAPVKIWDHSQKRESHNSADGPTYAWKEADGTVNLMIANFQAYRLRGPSLTNLTFDPVRLYGSLQVAHKIPEDAYNYRQFMMGPYSLDGVTFYALSHNEWYASVLIGDHDFLLQGDNGTAAMVNSWVTSVTSMKSTDGGASWALNTVAGNHTVAHPGFHWTGSAAFANAAYLHAANMTGLQQITRPLKEGSYYYAIGNLFQRDFTQINPATGQWQAPSTKEGFVMIRTTDFTNPNGWEHWVTGSTWQPLTNNSYGVFSPVYLGVTKTAAWSPTWFFDTTAQLYVIIYAGPDSSHSPVFYMTSPSLAAPSWSEARPILGTDELVTDPAGGPWLGFSGAHYPSVLDASSPGFNFEFVSSGQPYLFWSTVPGLYNGRGVNYANVNDVYRTQLQITYTARLARGRGFTARKESATTDYQCLPDTVDPRRPKGKW